jgi:hypothetical protein
MTITPDTQTREDIREELTSGPGVDHAVASGRRRSRARHGKLTWVPVVAAAVAAVALATFAFAGRNDPATPTPDPDLVRRAEQIEREAHLEGQARTHGGGPRTAPTPDPDLVRRAEQIERQAHLEGQARTYGGGAGTAPATPTEDGSSDDEFVPGSRRMPM